jgi:GMP synthase-like glutamine amidotransferase
MNQEDTTLPQQDETQFRRIGILMAGHMQDKLRPKCGDFDVLFKRLLDGRGFAFDAYSVVDGIFPSTIHDADGWLITGSQFGAYEGHDWIASLEDFLRQAYAAGVPIVGVCFGHQVLAQALGGKVEKYAGGWSVGPTDYVSSTGQHERLIAWHQDQVTELPEGATVIGSSDFCANAMLAYGDNALSVQPHPEYSAELLIDLIEARRDIHPSHVLAAVEARVGEPLTSSDSGQKFEEFFKRNRST